MEVITKVANILQEQTKRASVHIKNRALETGERFEDYKDITSARKKYILEILLRVPLFLVLHQWFLLSPYSNYWIIDIFLFILRYGAAVMLMGTWALNTGVHFLVIAHLTLDIAVAWVRHIAAVMLMGTWALNTGVHFLVIAHLTLDIAVAWVRHIGYHSYQDQAHEVCYEKDVLIWSDVTESWWIPNISSIVIQSIYLCYRSGSFFDGGQVQLSFLANVVLFATLLPDILCMMGIFTSFMSELSHWLQSALFILVLLVEVIHSVEIDNDVDKEKLKVQIVKLQSTKDMLTKQDCLKKCEYIQLRIKKRNEGGNFAGRFPGQWFFRDTILAFGIPYLLFAFLIELVIYQRAMSTLFSLDTIFEISTIWCTTPVVVLFVSFALGILSNSSVALCQFFLTTEGNIIEAFDANIGGIVQVSALITFTEANILSLENTEKTEAMKMVVFLSVYAVVFQTLDVLEGKILRIVNSGSSPGLLFYLRVGILTGLLVTGPTLSTLIVSKHLDVNPWLLFFASGNCTLIFRTGFMLTECVLVTLTWYTTQHLSKLEDIIHYSRVTKSLSLVTLNAVQCYCRYICPFFKGWWVFRLCTAVFCFIAVVALFVTIEINRYRSKNKMVTLLKNLPNVTFRPRTREDDEDDHECTICYSAITNGKALPCAHIFHDDCLRRWFQVRTVCPFCNTDIKLDT